MASNQEAVKAGYKQTEVGVIPEDWEVVRVDQVANVIDSLHVTPKFTQSGFAMVRVSDIKSGYLDLDGTYKVDEETYKLFTKNHTPKKGNIVLSRVGSYGVSSFVSTDVSFCMGQNTVVIESKINSYYLYTCLNTEYIKEQIEDGSYGSGYKSLSLKNIKDLLIAIPKDEEEQASIAKALSDTDARITTLNALIHKKEQIKQGAMQQLLTGKVRLKGFGEGVGVKQTELGEIPEDWSVSLFGDMLEENKLPSGLYKDKDAYGQGTKIIKLGDVFSKDYFEPSGAKRVKVTFKEENLYRVQVGDIFIALASVKLEGVGQVMLVNGLDEVTIYDHNVALIRLVNDVCPEYIFYLFKSRLVRKLIATGATQVGTTFLKASTIRGFSIPSPSKAEQIEIATTLAAIDKSIQILKQRLAKTKVLKQGMMQELLTGKTRLVPDAALAEESTSE